MSPSTLAQAWWPLPLSPNTLPTPRHPCLAQLRFLHHYMDQERLVPLLILKFRAVFHLPSHSCNRLCPVRDRESFRYGTTAFSYWDLFIEKGQNHIHLCCQIIGRPRPFPLLSLGRRITAPWTAPSLRTPVDSPGIEDSPSEVTEILEYGH